MNHDTRIQSIDGDTIVIETGKHLMISPGDTLTIKFNGDIMPMRRDEYIALTRYKEWCHDVDPRGESEAQGVGVPEVSVGPMVHNASAKWLWGLNLGLLGVLLWTLLWR